MLGVKRAFLAAVAALAFAPTAQAVPHMFVMSTDNAVVTFHCRALGLMSMDGAFKRFAAAISIDEAKPTTARVTVKVDASSLQTDDLDGIADLMGPDFFDVVNHPQMVFTSSSAALERPGVLRVYGTLTLRGVARPASFLVRYDLRGPRGSRMAQIEADSIVDRTDYGMTAYHHVVSDSVEVEAVGTMLEQPVPLALAH